MKWLDNLIEKFKRKPSQAEQKVKELNDQLVRLGDVLKRVNEKVGLEVRDFSTPVVTEEVKKESEFDVARKKFSAETDILVISHVAASHLNKEETEWLESLGNKVFYFGADSLINVAIVRAGRGW